MRYYVFFLPTKFPYKLKNFIDGLYLKFIPNFNGILSFNELKRVFIINEIGKMIGYF